MTQRGLVATKQIGDYMYEKYDLSGNNSTPKTRKPGYKPDYEDSRDEHFQMQKSKKKFQSKPKHDDPSYFDKILDYSDSSSSSSESRHGHSHPLKHTCGLYNSGDESDRRPERKLRPSQNEKPRTKPGRSSGNSEGGKPTCNHRRRGHDDDYDSSEDECRTKPGRGSGNSEGGKPTCNHRRRGHDDDSESSEDERPRGRRQPMNDHERRRRQDSSSDESSDSDCSFRQPVSHRKQRDDDYHIETPKARKPVRKPKRDEEEHEEERSIKSGRKLRTHYEDDSDSKQVRRSNQKHDDERDSKSNRQVKSKKEYLDENFKEDFTEPLKRRASLRKPMEQNIERKPKQYLEKTSYKNNKNEERRYRPLEYSSDEESSDSSSDLDETPARSQKPKSRPDRGYTEKEPTRGRNQHNRGNTEREVQGSRNQQNRGCTEREPPRSRNQENKSINMGIRN